MTMAALIATDSRAELSAKARKRRASSWTNAFPAFPVATLNKCFLQCTISLKHSSMESMNVLPSLSPHLKVGCGAGMYSGRGGGGGSRLGLVH